jgi:AraC-like DNA-binding protein
MLFVLYLFITWWFYVEVGTKYPSSHLVPKEIPRHPLYYIPVIIRSLQRILYYFLAYRVLISYQRSILHLFSDTSRINLRWVQWLINGYLVLILSIIALNLLIFQYPEYYNLLVLIIGVMVTLYVHLAAIRGIFQPTIWQVHGTMNKEEVEAEMVEAENIETKFSGENLKYRKGLEDAKMDEIITKINTLIQTEKLYREPELTLQSLAEKLHVPSYQVSLAINDGMKKKFYDLINGYRVEEAKRLLLSPNSRNYTILSVGFEAGFNSKTTFNTVFKKFTGFTPTVFRDQIKKEVPIS